ncbi:MAG: hypothetical protein RMM98_12185 [Acidobacteriota bacterium]|nr:hypothetical protein [Blastocatellia bacterium]MDW8240368.1 hypothetical protein [Acidobacteriota bacterium]
MARNRLRRKKLFLNCILPSLYHPQIRTPVTLTGVGDVHGLLISVATRFCHTPARKGKAVILTVTLQEAQSIRRGFTARVVVLACTNQRFHFWLPSDGLLTGLKLIDSNLCMPA